MDFQVIRAQAHAFRTVKCHRAKVGFGQAIFTHNALVCFVDNIFAEGHFHTHDMRRTEEAIRMLLHTENASAKAWTIIGAHAFKHAHAVMQCVGQNVNLGIAPGNEFTVEPYNAVAIGK
jgi:hypothetical protein